MERTCPSPTRAQAERPLLKGGHLLLCCSRVKCKVPEVVSTLHGGPFMSRDLRLATHLPCVFHKIFLKAEVSIFVPCLPAFVQKSQFSSEMSNYQPPRDSWLDMLNYFIDESCRVHVPDELTTRLELRARQEAPGESCGEIRRQRERERGPALQTRACRPFSPHLHRLLFFARADMLSPPFARCHARDLPECACDVSRMLLEEPRSSNQRAPSPERHFSRWARGHFRS